MKPRRLAALFILLLLVSVSYVDARRVREGKHRHVKAAAKKLARQLAKVQSQGAVRKTARVTATMSYAAAAGFCTERLKAAGDKGKVRLAPVVGWVGWGAGLSAGALQNASSTLAAQTHHILGTPAGTTSAKEKDIHSNAAQSASTLCCCCCSL